MIIFYGAEIQLHQFRGSFSIETSLISEMNLTARIKCNGFLEQLFLTGSGKGITTSWWYPIKSSVQVVKKHKHFPDDIR